MSQITLFIQPSDVIALTTFDGNIDVDNLKPLIFIAQTTHLKSFLGLKLYDKIYNDFVANTLTGDYQTIFENYVFDFMCYYSASLFCAFGGIKFSENGLHKVAGENMTSLDSSESEKIRLTYLDLVSNVEGNFKEFVKDLQLPELQGEVITVNENIPWH